MLDILNLIIIIIIFLLVLYFIINQNKEEFYIDKKPIDYLGSSSNCDKITISTKSEDKNYKNAKLLKYKQLRFLLKEHNNSQKLYEINEDNQISPKKLYLSMTFVNYKVISHNEHIYVLNLGNNELKVYANYDFQNEIKTFKINKSLQNKNNKIKDFYIYDDDNYNLNMDNVYIYYITTKDVYKEKLSHTLQSNNKILLNKDFSKVYDLNLLKPHFKINLINYEKILGNNEIIVIWNKYKKLEKQKTHIKNTIIVIIDQKINLYGYNIFKNTKKTFNMDLNNLVNIKIHNNHIYLLKSNGSISIINYYNNTFIDNHILINNNNIKYTDIMFFNKDIYVLSNDHILKLKKCIIEAEPMDTDTKTDNKKDKNNNQAPEKYKEYDLDPKLDLHDRIKHSYESEYNINYVNYKKLMEKGMASKAEFKIKYYTPYINSKNYDSNKTKYNNSCFFSGYDMIDNTDKNSENSENNTKEICDTLYSKY